MNHRERNFKEEKLTAEKCRKRLSPYLSVMSCSTAVIPLETGKEALCYEFHCKDSRNQESLVYINAESGKEENILLLLYSDGGVLTK